MRFKIYSLIFFNHVVAVSALLYFPLGLNWLWFLLGWFLFGKMGGEIGFHRYLCHQSFVTGRIRHHLLMILGCFNCFGSPISWIAIHRAHHQFADRPPDPHGGDLPWWKVWLTFWETSNISSRLILREMKDPEVRWYHKNYFGLLAVGFLLCGLVSIQFTAFFICLPAVITFHSAGLVNVLCHSTGYRNHETKDHSYNNLFVNLLTLGSGLHNNHHHQPNSPFCSEKWFEIDVPGFVIRTVLIKRSRRVAATGR